LHKHMYVSTPRGRDMHGMSMSRCSESKAEMGHTTTVAQQDHRLVDTKLLQ